MIKSYQVVYILKPVLDKFQKNSKEKEFNLIVGFVVVPCYVMSKTTYCTKKSEKTIYNVFLLINNENMECKVNNIFENIKDANEKAESINKLLLQKLYKRYKVDKDYCRDLVRSYQYELDRSNNIENYSKEKILCYSKMDNSFELLKADVYDFLNRCQRSFIYYYLPQNEFEKIKKIFEQIYNPLEKHSREKRLMLRKKLINILRQEYREQHLKKIIISSKGKKQLMDFENENMYVLGKNGKIRDKVNNLIELDVSDADFILFSPEKIYDILSTYSEENKYNEMHEESKKILKKTNK